ncbi:MAG: ISNCY family transposase [Candidatus Methanoperedens sp.]|nr:ISNCY family transposase [Candidatus Methanoperedens sp.]MCZ7371796.1 ISNCY family transposase [Candidatus Methanoperedens sp.]
MLKSDDIRDRIKDIDDFLLKQYKERKVENKRDWRTYEQQLLNRIKGAIRNLEPLIDQSINIEIHRGPGRPPDLELKQRVIILLLKELLGQSNRMMASMLGLFSLLSGIDVGYKTVERLYSNHDVEMAIHNLHILILREKGVKNIDACGDGTGYSLTIKKHYASETQIRKDKVKEYSGTKAFVYSFKLLDLKSKMYVAFGMSLKSEKEAFDRAIEMIKKIDVKIDSMRLDKYYSFSSYVDKFGDAKVYVIPRKNATVRGSWKWKDSMEDFVNNTFSYLGQYFRRNNSESGFSADKRMFGWTVGQKRDDRISTALTCTGLWHNLLNLYPT